MSSHPRASSVDLDSPDRPFDNIINFRDVGRSINGFLGRKVLKEGVLYRSARLDDASERDKRRLTEELRIATVIDLRSSTEHQMAVAKRRAETGANDATPPVSDEHLVDLPGVRRCLISLTGKAFERSLVWRLDWWNFVKVLALAASGYRADAVTLVGEQVMTPRGLIGLGQDTLDSSTAEMRAVFETLGSPGGDALPVVVHCTQGKDRTGLIVLLALLVTGAVDEDALAADYVRSEAELVVEVEERMKEIRKLGLNEEYTKCPAGFTRAIRAYLREKYGGVEGYLRYVGVEQETVEGIKRALLA